MLHELDLYKMCYLQMVSCLLRRFIFIQILALSFVFSFQLLLECNPMQSPTRPQWFSQNIVSITISSVCKISSLSGAMAMIALALLLNVCIVSALRETYGLEGEHHNSFWSHCRSSKCTGGTYDRKGDLQDCEVNVNKPFYTDSDDRMCEETCKVVESGESKSVKVKRKSGGGKESCSPGGALQEFAADFVKLEDEALRIPTGQSLPMKAKKVQRFLEAVRDEVLRPEMEAAGGHGYSRTISKELVENVAIIGDLHGQLFNLIAFLLAIKKQYHGKGFSTLPGSYLLFCDPRMTYLFMGDYVDRGEMGVELLMLLLAYKASCPQSLILLQGNHETSSLWRSYGFAEELHYKFNSRIEEHLVSSVTATLPFVAVLPGRWMAMHGGISPSFVEVCSGQAGRFESCLDDSIGQTLTWPDPHDGNGFQFSHRDGFHGTIRDFGILAVCGCMLSLSIDV
eukprot:Skav201620  [mRNA]  locus=scaffold5983:35985:38262:- [translate_table: standard]